MEVMRAQNCELDLSVNTIPYTLHGHASVQQYFVKCGSFCLLQNVKKSSVAESIAYMLIMYEHVP